jgi:hypothetical protein
MLRLLAPAVEGKKRGPMTDQDEQVDIKAERRAMFIITAVGVLIILGLMGLGMWNNPNWMQLG